MTYIIPGVPIGNVPHVGVCCVNSPAFSSLVAPQRLPFNLEFGWSLQSLPSNCTASFQHDFLAFVFSSPELLLFTNSVSLDFTFVDCEHVGLVALLSLQTSVREKKKTGNNQSLSTGFSFLVSCRMAFLILPTVLLWRQCRRRLRKIMNNSASC